MDIGKVGSFNTDYLNNTAYEKNVRKENESKGLSAEENRNDAANLGTSADGDTAKASRQGLENIKEGLVINKSNQLSSFSGEQLEVMYQKGEITKNELDREIEKRARLRGEDDKKLDDKAKENDIEDEKDDKAIARANGNVNATNAVNSIKGDDATSAVAGITSDEKKAEDKKTEEKQEERRKQIITEEMEATNKVSEQMGELTSVKNQVETGNQMYENAIKNDRVATVDNILQPDKSMHLSGI